MGGWGSMKENLAPPTGRLPTTTSGIAAGLQDSGWALPGWAARTPSSDDGWRWRNPWERASDILQNSQLWEWAAKNWEHGPPAPSPPKKKHDVQEWITGKSWKVPVFWVRFSQKSGTQAPPESKPSSHIPTTLCSCQATSSKRKCILKNHRMANCLVVEKYKWQTEEKAVTAVLMNPTDLHACCVSVLPPSAPSLRLCLHGNAFPWECVCCNF